MLVLKEGSTGESRTRAAPVSSVGGVWPMIGMSLVKDDGWRSWTEGALLIESLAAATAATPIRSRAHPCPRSARMRAAPSSASLRSEVCGD
jgi:hypothetical protein